MPVTGWTGQVVLSAMAGGPAVVAPAGRTSVLALWASVAGAARTAWGDVTWSWELTLEGMLLLRADQGSYALEFAGNCGPRLGFESSSYSGVREWTAENSGLHVIAPGPIGYAQDLPRTPAGEIGYATVATTSEVGATELRRPSVQMTVTQADLVRFAEAWTARRYPGEVDVYVGPEAIVSIRAGAYRSRRLGMLGHSRVEFGGYRG